MALFKICKGPSSRLPETITPGYCWFEYDTGLFMIDYADEDGTLHRKTLNAKEAESITGMNISAGLNPSDSEIPTSKAVSDALGKKVIMKTWTSSDV